ncbi:MAG: hypothetical protein ABIR39_23650 [Nocardioides sp.]|uniref:hypothetical protein n=1 Tax=Nocardioides sp. TaxID=35761 RepID=UPI003265C174
MSLLDPCLIRSRGPSGQVVVRLGMPLVDDYLEFMEGRCRPNTVLAAANDLRVFFGVIAKPPDEVVASDVLGFITAQRTGRTSIEPYCDGVSQQRPDFRGMTVNEALATAGLIEQWDAAIEAGNRNGAVEVLKKVLMSESCAASTVDAVLAEPSKYGYPRRT